MKVKEFEAPSLKDCLKQVRDELGPEAVILDTSKTRKGGVMGIGAREAIRIVAGIGVTVNESARPATISASTVAPDAAARAVANKVPLGPGALAVAMDRPVSLESPRRTTPVMPRPERASNPSSHTLDGADSFLPEFQDARIRNLEEQLRSLRVTLEGLRTEVAVVPTTPARHSRLDRDTDRREAAQIHPDRSSQSPIVDLLRNAEISEGVADRIIQELPDLTREAGSPSPLALAAIRDGMQKQIYCRGPIRLSSRSTRTVALVGPTGVGKTTTIAKLAAHYSLVEKKRVGLITLDTYRIAAVEQLKLYAQIINIPIRVAQSAREIGSALEALQGYDLVLVDTAGRSHKNTNQLRELKSLVSDANLETHLVLSASTRMSDLRDQAENFKIVGADHLLFTKLDETSAYGCIFSVAAETRLPISYLTMGQKVPEDIEPVDAAKLVEMVLRPMS